MRIPSFDIRAQRSIAIASCAAVPPLMVIAGPNGTGKSTLLHSLRQVGGGAGPILYVGPHRTLRRQHVQGRFLLANTISMADMLTRMDTPGGFEGVSLITGSRDPWSGDDSANYLKHSLCQIEFERQRAIAARFDAAGSIAAGSIPDPWAPLRELTTSLLPHLAFARIDTENQTQIRCLWRVHKNDTLVDLDDLSSGEKSVVQMFYPLVEHRIRETLQELTGKPPNTGARSTCLLIDEPELHLHPNLQAKVLDYMRQLAYQQGVQCILATHSPTIVEYATFEELYLLMPIELVEVGGNQLVQIATDEARLQFLRETFGGARNLTALQPVLIVEGAHEKDTTSVLADRKVYRALSPNFDRVTVIAGGGKSECFKLREVLAPALAAFTTQLKVSLLLDRDTADERPVSDGAGTFYLPVSMVENLLIDPDAMWEALQSVVEKTSLKSTDDIAGALDLILDAMEPDELERRVLAALGADVFRPKRPIASVMDQVGVFNQLLGEKYEAAKIDIVRKNAEAAVAKLKAEKKRREFFHGKEALGAFVKQHLHKTGLPKNVFLFETARHAQRRKSVTTFFAALFADLLPEPKAETAAPS